MENWPKPISEFPINKLSHGYQITHAGKKELMRMSYMKFKSGRNSAEKMDYAWNFFVHACHLKEWIEHFSGIKDFKSSWTDNIKYSENEYYKMCYDICNKSKHFVLTRPQVTNDISVLVSPEMKDGVLEDVFYLKFDDKYIPMIVLMDIMIKFWDLFFSEEL